MKAGLIGLPTVGKTTFFNLLTDAGVKTSAFSSGKVQANLALARVPDERIGFLAGIYHPKKTTYAQIEVTDVPGLVRGASEGLGVGNQFLDSIRNMDALIHIVRAFSDKSIVHADGSIDIIRDIETIDIELLLADLQLVETRVERIEASRKVTKEMEAEREVLMKLREALENEVRLSHLELTREERGILEHLNFLTEKPVIVAINIDEEQLVQGYSTRQRVIEYCAGKDLPLLEVCSKVEVELNELDENDRQEFMDEIGIKEPGIDLLAKAMYARLGLISFLTTGEDEVKAWTIKEGTKAKVAAGKIHSDIERGFIRVEVVSFQDFKEFGGMVKAREAGRVRLEGKEYLVQDGDIINFRFNV
jgi:GTP-binding protein YchF